MKLLKSTKISILSLLEDHNVTEEKMYVFKGIQKRKN